MTHDNDGPAPKDRPADENPPRANGSGLDDKATGQRSRGCVSCAAPAVVPERRPSLCGACWYAADRALARLAIKGERPRRRVVAA